MANQKNRAILLFCASLLLPSFSSAASFTVNTTIDAVDTNPGDGICSINADNTQCSLRAAIMETNALTNSVSNGEEVPDEIQLNDGEYLFTLPGTGEDAAASGDLDITDSVILTGNTTDLNAVVINGGGIFGHILDRVFHIISNNKVIKVEFNYLVITGGYSTDSRAGGGGICIKCVASDGEAYQPTELGTLNVEVNTTFTPTFNFFNSDTTRPEVTLRHVEVRNNYDLISGSGIMNAGILTIEDSVIRDNTSSYQFAMATGQNGQFTFNSQFIGGGKGGGISNWGGKLTLRRSIITNNRSQTGGAIYSQTLLAQFRDERVLIENCQITNNQAFMGGGIFNVSGDWDFPARQLRDYGFIIRQSTIDNNQAEYAGGGIYNLGLGAMQLSNVTVSNNVASDLGLPNMPNKGGGIYHSGKILDLVNTTINNNTAQERRLTGKTIADDATGGDEIFLDVSQANVDPLTNLPWRFTLLNTIIGDATSTDTCNGTLNYENFVTDNGGNVDVSGTCALTGIATVVNSGPLNKPGTRASESSVSLGPLANNGGIPGNELPDGTFPPTQALLAGTAINSGLNCSDKDQRGFGRDATACDPGAFQTASNTKGISSKTDILPVARDDRIVTASGIDVFVPVSRLLANDNDPLQRGMVTLDKNSLQLVDQNGVVVNAVRGSQATNTGLIDFVKFTPAADFVGETAFTYTVRVKDKETGNIVNSAAATVSVEVKNQNIEPVAYSQTFILTAGETVISDLHGGLSGENTLFNNFDPEQAALEYYVGSEPTQGNLSITTDGSFTYSADADAQGTDSFTYTVKDAGGLSSKPASVIIYINPVIVNSFANPVANVTAGKLINIDLSNGVMGNFYFGLQRELSPKQGEVLWLNEHTGQLTYRANEATSADDEFGFSIVNLQLNSTVNSSSTYNGSAKISIQSPTGTNNAPEASAMDISLDASLSRQLYLAGSDTDNDVLFYQIETQPGKGQLSEFDPVTGSVLYTTDPHASGTDSFSFSVGDGLSQSSPASVTIQLTPQTNIPPVAVDDTAMTPSDLSIAVNVLKNDSDENNDKLSLTTDSTLSMQGGTVEVNNAGIIRYTPPAGFIGEDEITYQIDDGFNGMSSARLKLTVIPASAGSYSNQPTNSNAQSPTNGQENTPSDGNQDTTKTNSPTADISTSENGSGGSGVMSWWLLILSTLLLIYRSAGIRENQAK
ncbi:MAG: Ig-like domain-containing protein [Gammaproteobacteria bacterium]|nr:Ig-like domain-containing protein [Gammaproteobacteria bacterium]